MRFFTVCCSLLIAGICFGAGEGYGIERINYNLSISFIPVGKATLKYNHSRLTGRRTMSAHAYSSGLVDFFYDFDFKFTNLLDKKSGLPLVATKAFREGKYYSENKVRFDHFSRKDSSIIYSDSIGKKVVPKNIFDILSGVYHVMNKDLSKPLKKGDTITTSCYFTDEVWKLKMIYAGDEQIKTFRGKEICRRFYFLPQKGHFFKNDDDISFWFTKDGLNIPILVKMNFVLSSIRAELESYTNTMSPKRPLTP